MIYNKSMNSILLLLTDRSRNIYYGETFRTDCISNYGIDFDYITRIFGTDPSIILKSWPKVTNYNRWAWKSG